MKNKTDTIIIESKIIQCVNRDNVNNNTVHFVWDHHPNFVSMPTLHIKTCHAKTGHIFLLSSFNGTSKRECLEKALVYMDEEYKADNNYTVKWISSKYPERIQTSYFRAKSVEEVERKFGGTWSGTPAGIIEITLSPQA